MRDCGTWLSAHSLREERKATGSPTRPPLLVRTVRAGVFMDSCAPGFFGLPAVILYKTYTQILNYVHVLVNPVSLAKSRADTAQGSGIAARFSSGREPVKDADMTQGPYKMGTIVRLTGLSPVLLRAWERRHALLSPLRGAGGQRLYTAEDLGVLRRTQELLKEGRSIGEVAALGRDALLGLPATIRIEEPSSAKLKVRADSGGAILESLRDEIIRAAVALDAAAIHRALDQAAATVSFPVVIEGVIEPAARQIGDLWQAGKCTVASEHLATSIFVHRVRRVLDSAEWIAGEKSEAVVAACIPGEEHELGLLILACFLNRKGVRVLFLGANLPFADLRRACAVRRPRAVLLSVTLQENFQRERLAIRELLRTASPGIRFYIGGSGVPAGDRSLEAAGLRLGSTGSSAQETAERIAEDLGQAKRKSVRRRRAALRSVRN